MNNSSLSAISKNRKVYDKNELSWSPLFGKKFDECIAKVQRASLSIYMMSLNKLSKKNVEFGIHQFSVQQTIHFCANLIQTNKFILRETLI